MIVLCMSKFWMHSRDVYKRQTYDSKKEKIEGLYPDEKRPGLILGQMDTFYNRMKENDLVVIPSSGGKQIAIGKIGSIVEKVCHKQQSDDYAKCDYSHKRSVEWLKVVDSWQDIYPVSYTHLDVYKRQPKGPLGRAMNKKLFVYAGPEHKHEAQKPEVLTF